MLKLTKKADYALMAMKHLADHAQAGTGSASAKDVADSFGIPPEALAKILQRLVRAGLLLSHHGTHGGYRLARAAHTISAFEVIQAIDGHCLSRLVSRFVENVARVIVATFANPAQGE